jgi:hypothetical protein
MCTLPEPQHDLASGGQRVAKAVPRHTVRIAGLRPLQGELLMKSLVYCSVAEPPAGFSYNGLQPRSAARRLNHFDYRQKAIYLVHIP